MVTKDSVLYSQYRSKIKSGDLLLWNIQKVSSWVDFLLILTQKTLKVDYSHFGIAVELNDRLFCLEATMPYVRLIPLSLKDDFSVLSTNVNFTNEHASYLFSKIGMKYNVFDLFNYIANIKNDTNSYYCTKLAGDYYYKIGLIDDEDAGATPKTLIESVRGATGEPIVKVINDRANYHEL